MDFNVPVLIASLVFSCVGYVYFSYGKRTTNLQMTATGISLMVYGYFTPSLIACIGVGALLSALPFIFKWWNF